MEVRHTCSSTNVTEIKESKLFWEFGVVELLVMESAPLNMQSEAMTTLFEAAASNDAAAATRLLQGGADKEAKDADGDTALMGAAYSGSVEVAKVLVEAGADKEAKDSSGGTALMLAAQSGSERSAEVTKVLVEAGADTEAKEANGGTALMMAAFYGRIEVAELLIESGANKEAKDAQGDNAASNARKNGHLGVFALLDPAAAAELGQELKQAFEQATLVHVISTRFRRFHTQLSPHIQTDKFDNPLSCDPFKSAQEVKKALERIPGPTTCVFNPNRDNACLMGSAFLMGGKGESASAIRLKNYRWALDRAHQTGGCCVQVVVKPGLSIMQVAEAEMAAEKGVRVVRLDCSNVIQKVNLEAPVDDSIHQAAYKHDLVQMPGWAQLTALAQQSVDDSIHKPLSRKELESLVNELLEETDALQAQLDKGPPSLPPQASPQPQPQTKARRPSMLMRRPSLLFASSSRGQTTRERARGSARV